LMTAKQEDLTAINEIGPEIAASIVEFFHEHKNIDVINKFRKAGVVPQNKEINNHAPLKGKSFVFTGSMERMGRNEAKTIVENLGGTIHSSVTRKTTYVVAGNEAGSKLDKAKASGIKIIDEKEFLRLVNR
ncbi:MAG: NAD-dependent DNA ligase LigA, partial [Syntrophaceae bacterium]|nr:NAD-dependent DNA ligase LigA [Syntrophaceae bacterium]